MPTRADVNSEVAIRAALKQLRISKPGDRSEKDRWYQIVITDVEKALSVFNSQITREGEL